MWSTRELLYGITACSHWVSAKRIILQGDLMMEGVKRPEGGIWQEEPPLRYQRKEASKNASFFILQ